MAKNAAAALALGLVAANAFAGTISEAVISGQVQQFTDNGTVSGCGVVLVALETTNGAPAVLQVFNGSFSLMGIKGGLVKGRGATISRKQALSGSPGANALKPQRTEGVWLKAPDSKATSILPGQAPLKSEDPGYVMYVADLQPLLAVSDAVLAGKPIQIGMKTAAINYEVILSGVVQLTDVQQSQFAQCLSDWYTGLKERYKDSLANEPAPSPTK